MSVKPARTAKTTQALPVLNPNAAGADIGATEIYAAVPQDRDPQPVRRFATFTQDLNALADWLQKCGVQTLAMESTGVYWIPLFQILEERGLEVCLVNARHVKGIRSKTSQGEKVMSATASGFSTCTPVACCVLPSARLSRSALSAPCCAIARR